jgi:hypothetical protein
MRNGTAPARLLHELRRRNRRVVKRADFPQLADATHISHPDRVMRRLNDEGLVEKLGPGVWLVPTQKPPALDVPRYWSHPSLADPQIISALVVANPTVRNIASTLVSYGRKRVESALEAAKEEGSLNPFVEAISRRMIESAWAGIADAAARR